MPTLAVLTEKIEEEVVAELHRKPNGEVDMLLYCASMAPDSKLDDTDRNIIKILSLAFKEQIWKKTVLVLTFADVVMIRNRSNPKKHASVEETVKRVCTAI